MTGPEEPWDGAPEQEWDFPELTPPSADPTSVELPEPGPEPIYDTGSDGWWRAQAAAQREAAGSDPAPLFHAIPPADLPPLEPTDLVEPTVLNDPAFLPSGPSPLDDAYLPEEQVFPPVAEDTWGEPPPFVEPSEPFLEESFDEPVAHEEAVAFEEPEPEPFASAAPLMRPLVIPEPPIDPYDDEPAPVEEVSDDAGVGWRRAVAWAALAVAGVGLIVVAFLLLGKDEPKGTPTVSAPSNVASIQPTTEPTATATPEPTPSVSKVPAVPPTATAAAAPIVPLTVLNNSRVSHLAERSAAKFEAGGWPVPATGNYRGQLSETTIFYPAGQKASALRFARQFGVRALPRPATLPGRGMTVVVTRDFA